MERITQKTEGGYFVPPRNQPQAFARLGRWEDMMEQLEQEQANIAEQLDHLRGVGKEKSVRFRELFARKLTVSTMLDTLRHSGGS